MPTDFISKGDRAALESLLDDLTNRWAGARDGVAALRRLLELCGECRGMKVVHRPGPSLGVMVDCPTCNGTGKRGDNG
jgi:hypothetical protein